MTEFQIKQVTDKPCLNLTAKDTTEVSNSAFSKFSTVSKQETKFFYGIDYISL